MKYVLESRDGVHMKTFRLPFVLALALLALGFAAGCKVVGPDYQPPQRELPASWREEPGAGLASGPAQLGGWWKQLGDPALEALVERATRGGLDLREALARVREARARRGIASSDQLPSLDARAAFERRAESDNTPLGGFVPDADNYSLGFDAAWELDLWGRVRRSVEAADAELGAQLEDVRDVYVTVAAEVARNYVELRAFQRRLALAERNVALQQETLVLVQGRFDAGLVNERDLAQARANLESTRARVPALEGGLRAAENRLAVLLGEPPGNPGTLPVELAALAEPRPIPVPPSSVAIGLPADLLRRRADVRRAERALAAESARIGVAEGELYPRLTLTGTLGLAAEHSDDLFSSGSDMHAFGPSLRWNLFDGGRRRAGVAAQEARAEQAELRWQRAVLLALEESENALSAFVREQTRRGSLVEAAAQSRLAVELAQAQYREGLSDFQAVLDSERSVAELEDQVAQSDAAVTTNLVALYKALGGGWDEPGADPVLAAGI